MSRSLAAALLLAPLAACSSDSSFVARSQLDVFEQVPNDEVDILFVVDDSSSMAEEQNALNRGFGGFMDQIREVNSKFHLGVVSTSADTGDPNAGRLLGEPAVLTSKDDYLTAFRDRAMMGTGGSDKEQGLWAAELALSPERLAGYNQGFLREDATLLVAFVTDEEDCSHGGLLDGQESTTCYTAMDELTPVDHFLDAYAAAKGGDRERVRVGAIVGPRGDDRCETAYPGERYARLAVETGGLIGDICESDWSDMLSRLGLAAAGVRESFTLSYDAVPETLLVAIDGEEIDEDERHGWTYDPSSALLMFHGDAVPPRGSEIVVEYDIVTGL